MKVSSVKNKKMRSIFDEDYGHISDRKERGITLIALIITIIVMLILLAVTISILVKSNIIGIAEQAADKTKSAYEKESNMSQIKVGDKTYSSIDEYIQSNQPIDWEAILADANANPEKYMYPGQEETNGDIGIGTDGKPVNMDLWNYMNLEDMDLGNGINLGIYYLGSV